MSNSVLLPLRKHEKSLQLHSVLLKIVGKLRETCKWEQKLLLSHVNPFLFYQLLSHYMSTVRTLKQTSLSRLHL